MKIQENHDGDSMTWNSFYSPPDMNLWQGREDAPPHAYFFQIMQSLPLLQPLSPQIPAFALIGFCCDEGIHRNLGRIGAKEGPSMIRKALAPLSVQKNLLCYDAGDIICHDNQLEEAQEALGEAIAILLKHRLTPILLGGGHELAWGHYQGIEKKIRDQTLGIVNFDAHLDMRPLLSENKGSSGTPFLQIAKACEAKNHPFHYYCIGIQKASNTQFLLDTAKKYHTQILFADDLHQEN